MYVMSKVRTPAAPASRQPLTPECQKIISDSQPKTNSVPLMNKKIARCTLKKRFKKIYNHILC